jgi:predicted RNA polymerase sigma factor
VTDRPGQAVDELLLRELTPAVIGVLVRRGVDFATAEDAVQEALIQATLTWPEGQPADPKGWLVTVAWRKVLDAYRSESSRRDREQRVAVEPPRPQTTRCSSSSCARIRR